VVTQTSQQISPPCCVVCVRVYCSYCFISRQALQRLDQPRCLQENGKPVTFKRELLNTCQDQFEGMAEQRGALLEAAAAAPANGGTADAAAGRRALRMRELGTVRLLAELYNKDLVTPAVINIVVKELVKRGCPGGNFDGDVIECVVQARCPPCPLHTC
jgi:hypothetical protein